MAPEAGTGMAREPETQEERIDRLCRERDASVPGSIEEQRIGKQLLEAIFDVSD